MVLKRILGHKIDDVKLNRIADIYMGVGHISLASVTIPALIDKFDNDLLILGLLWAGLFWTASIVLTRKKT